MTDERLRSLEAEQQRALATGDPVAITAATRALLAETLEEMAGIWRKEGKVEEARALEQKAAESGNTTGSLAVAEGAGGSEGRGASAARSSAERGRLASQDRELRVLLASSFNDLGTSEAQQQEFPAALRDFLEAEHWATPAPSLLRNIGVAAFRLQNFPESTRALEAYLRSSPEDGKARVMLGMSLFSQGSFAAAAKDFAAAPEVVAADPRASYGWAFSLAHSGQQQHANEIATTLSEQTLPPEALSLVCHVFMDTEAYEQSAACFRRAYAHFPSLKLAHYQVAESLLRLDRPAQAVPELKEELQLSPGDPNVEYSLAYALLQTSEKDEAKKLLEVVIAADPSHAQAQYQLGKLQFEAGELNGAVQHLEAAEINAPGADYIHYQLQTAYRKLGRVADADRELAAYRDIKAKARARAPGMPK